MSIVHDLLSLCESINDVIELTQYDDPKTLKDALGKNHNLEKITYKGEPITKAILLNDRVSKALAREADIGVKVSASADYDEYTIDGQECYLGYDPKNQEFYTAFNLSPRSICTLIKYKLDDSYDRIKVTGYQDGSSNFYNELYKNFRGKEQVVDLRLD